MRPSSLLVAFLAVAHAQALIKDQAKFDAALRQAADPAPKDPADASVANFTIRFSQLGTPADADGGCNQILSGNQGFCTCTGNATTGELVAETVGGVASCANCIGCIGDCDLACLGPLTQ